MKSEQLWNLKDKKGRIYGPFTTSKIMELIEKGALDGEEYLSPQNTQRWIEISKYPEFYEAVLESLNSEKKELTQAEIEKELVVPEQKVTEQRDEAKKRGRAVEEFSAQKGPSQEAPTQQRKRPEAPVEEVIIDLKPREQIKKKQDGRFFLVLAALVCLFAIGYIYFEDQKPEVKVGEKIHLRLPQQKRVELGQQDVQRSLQKALSEFQSDTFEGYYQAQNILATLLESNPKATEAISLLCLAYRELWPFAYKDSQDLQTLTALVQSAQKENALDVHGATCRAVQAMLVGSEESATTAVQNVLNDFPTAAVIYEMKAELLYKNGQKNPAIAYLQKTQSLWPNWIKPFFVEAQIRTEIQDYSNAVRVLKNILAINPQHDKSKIETGIIEISHFSNPRGLDYLQVGLKNHKIPSPLKVRGYFALANYYLKSNPNLALEYAQKAYSLDPKNMALRDTILSLGGEEALSDVKSQDSQLMVVGDNYLRNKNYLAAQAEYKTAFEVNPKNSLAALRASESLWNLNQTDDAILWAQKSIKADPKFIEGYIKLADYYSQKFDFKVAAEYLAKAQNEAKTNYLVFRGYAQLELRRQNYQDAVKRAEQALRLYDSDIESLIVVSSGYIAQRQYDKAFQYSSKAIQMDSNNIKAHEVYAEALLGLKGINPAAQYMGERIATFPNIADYRVSLGALYLKDERFMDATRMLEGAVEFDPNNYRGHMLLSKAYLLQGRINESIKSNLKASALDPTNAEPLFELGQIYMRDQKTWAKALKNFQKVLEINPRYPKVYYMAGKTALLMGSKGQALQYAESEKKMNPSLADPYILAADISFTDGNYARAVNELRRAVQIRPNDSQLYVEMAKSHRLLGQLDVASAMLRTAMSKESGNAEIYKEQGLVFEKKGDIDAALAGFSRYLELKPNAEDRKEIQQKMSTLGGT